MNNGCAGLAAACGFAVLVAVCGAGTTRAQSSPAAVRIDLCVLFTDDIAQLGVQYTNQTAETLQSITLRARYGSGWIDFTDKGAFAPGASIYHILKLRNADAPRSLQPSLNLGQPQDCRVVRTETIGGAIWTDPAFGADFSIPTPALDSAIPQTNEPVAVTGCMVSVRWHDAWIRVRYRSGKQPIADVVFRARYGTGAFDIADSAGVSAESLATRTLIRYNFPGDRYVVYGAIDDPNDCVPVRVTFANGTTWSNPAAGTTPPPIPTAAPLVLESLGHMPIKRHEALPEFFSTPAPTRLPEPASSLTPR